MPALSHSRSTGRRSVSLLRLRKKPEEPHKWLTDLLPVLLLCDSAGIVARDAALNASLQHCGRVAGARCPPGNACHQAPNAHCSAIVARRAAAYRYWLTGHDWEIDCR